MGTESPPWIKERAYEYGACNGRRLYLRGSRLRRGLRRKEDIYGGASGPDREDDGPIRDDEVQPDLPGIQEEFDSARPGGRMDIEAIESCLRLLSGLRENFRMDVSSAEILRCALEPAPPRAGRGHHDKPTTWDVGIL